MSFEVLYYPGYSFYPIQLGNILVQLQDRYVGYLFLFDSKEKGYIQAINYGFVPKVGFIFKKHNTLTDYLIIIVSVRTIIIQNEFNKINNHSSFAQVLNLLEYLTQIDSDGEEEIAKPIIYFDKKQLTKYYINDDDSLDCEYLSKVFNRYLLNQLPIPLLNPAWKRNKPLIESARQVREIMNAETEIENLLERCCYGLPKEMYSQMFAVWETGENKSSNLNFLEMTKKLKIFLERVNKSNNTEHLIGSRTVYAAINECLIDPSLDETMQSALILSDAYDNFRIEIIPSGWDNDTYTQRLPSTESEHWERCSSIEHDGSEFKLFAY